MDLSNLDTSKHAEAGVFMPLRSPADGTTIKDEDTGNACGIVLLGKDSKEFQAFANNVTNRRLREQGKSGKIKMTAEEIEEDAVELLVRCTKQLVHIKVDGKELEGTAGARTLYTRPGLRWVREQVDEFVGDREQFLGKSNDNS
jgi:hypothetical protein